jgi:hypothetical protein
MRHSTAVSTGGLTQLPLVPLGCVPPSRKPFDCIQSRTHKRFIATQLDEVLENFARNKGMALEEVDKIYERAIRKRTLPHDADAASTNTHIKVQKLTKLMDVQNLSVGVMHEVCTIFGQKGVNALNLTNYRKRLNAIVMEQLEINEGKECVYVSPSTLVKIIKKHDAEAVEACAKAWAERTGGDIKNAPLQLLHQGDGRNFGSNHQSVLGTVRVRHSLAKQLYVLYICRGSENYPSLALATHDCREDMRQLQADGLVVWWLSGDMKFLNLVLGLGSCKGKCTWCVKGDDMWADVSRENRARKRTSLDPNGQYGKEADSLFWFIPMDRVVIDILHMLIRMVERKIAWVITDVISHDMSGERTEEKLQEVLDHCAEELSMCTKTQVRLKLDTTESSKSSCLFVTSPVLSGAHLRLIDQKLVPSKLYRSRPRVDEFEFDSDDESPVDAEGREARDRLARRRRAMDLFWGGTHECLAYLHGSVASATADDPTRTPKAMQEKLRTLFHLACQTTTPDLLPGDKGYMPALLPMIMKSNYFHCFNDHAFDMMEDLGELASSSCQRIELENKVQHLAWLHRSSKRHGEAALSLVLQHYRVLLNPTTYKRENFTCEHEGCGKSFTYRKNANRHAAVCDGRIYFSAKTRIDWNKVTAHVFQLKAPAGSTKIDIQLTGLWTTGDLQECAPKMFNTGQLREACLLYGLRAKGGQKRLISRIAKFYKSSMDFVEPEAKPKETKKKRAKEIKNKDSEKTKKKQATKTKKKQSSINMYS